MKTMQTIRKTAQGILAGIALAAFAHVSSFGQSMASVPKADVLTAPAGLEAVMYQVPETAKIKVHLVNHTSEPVVLQLRDAKNQVVYSEKVSSKNYIRKFDLAQLGDGTYSLELRSGDQRIVRELDLQTVTARTVEMQ